MTRLSLALGLLLLLGGGGLGANPEPFRTCTVSGTTILDPDRKPIRWRGFNVQWWTQVTDKEAADIQGLGANCVRYMFGYNPKGQYDPAQIEQLERHIQYFTKRGIWVVPVLYTFEVPDPAFPADPKKKLGPWSNPAMKEEFTALWRDVMSRLDHDPFIAAWEPLNEPHDTPAPIVAAWYRDIVPNLFRKRDHLRPIVVEGANYSHAEDLTDEVNLDDPNIIYAFHFYDPYNFTTDIQTPPLAYPGQWNKAKLQEKIERAKLFREKHQVPVWCGEFGSKTAAPGYEQWIRDVSAILEADHFDWCLWAWAVQPKDLTNTSFDINTDKKETFQLAKELFHNALFPKTLP